MAKKKYLHVMELNTPLAVCEEFLYSYGNTKDIRLELSKTGIRITFSFNKVYSKDDMLGYGKFYIFPDAIKKALLLYLVKFSKNLDLTAIRLKIDGGEVVIDVKDTPLVYSLVNGSLLRQMDSSFQNKAVLDGIIGFTKSKQDHRMASLFALLCSKSKIYEAERFIYLWMAFNGLYSFFGEKAADIRNLKSLQEAQGIGYLLALEGQAKARVFASDSKSIA